MHFVSFTLDAQSPVGRHFVIVDSVVPYSCCLNRLIHSLFQSMKRASVASIPKVEGMVQEKFSGAPHQTLSCFAPPIITLSGATEVIFLFIESITTNLTIYYTVQITIQYYRDDAMGSERQ